MKNHDENIEAMESKIHYINTQIDIFQSKVESLPGKVSSRFSNVVDELKTKKATLLDKVESLKKASDSSYQDLEIGVEMSLDDLKMAYTSAKERFERELS